MSTLNVSNITDGTDTVETGYVLNGSAKAWINFNGTGTPTARDSLNVSSLTDDATGQFTVNLSSNMNNANYTGSWFSNANTGSNVGSFSNDFTGNFFGRTTSLYKVAAYAASSYVDALNNDSTIFGDLA